VVAPAGYARASGNERYGIFSGTVVVEAELPERVQVAVTLYVAPEVQVMPVQVSVATPDPLAVNAPEVRVVPDD